MATSEIKDSTLSASGSLFRGPKRALVNWWPILLALVILAYLFDRIPLGALWEALKTGPWLWLGAYVVLVVLLILLADTYGTGIALRVMGLRPRFSVIFLVRGATYLLSLLNYSLGQGAFGIYLQRAGVPTSRATGIILFLLVTNFGVLLGMFSLALLAGALPGEGFSGLPALAFGLAGVMVAYLIVVACRPRFLQGWKLPAPLLEAGLYGHLRAAVGRIPHVLTLILTLWGGLRLWGIPVPLMQGFLVIPIVLFLLALPITPAGLGTFQAGMVILLSPYVPLANPEARAAAVLAFSLVYHFLGIIFQAILALWCFQKINRFEFFRSCLRKPPVVR